MKVVAVETPIFQAGDDLHQFLAKQLRKLPTIPEESFIVITSKVISVAQGQFVPVETGEPAEKHDLVRQQADLYLEPTASQYGVMLAIKNGHLAVNAGIDQSNVQEQYVLWPEDLQKTTNEIWQFLRRDFSLKKLGVIVTDSTTIPLRWGVVGTALAHCGFKALINKIGEPDLFGKKLAMTQIGVAEAVAVAAVLEMGEGNESRPLAVVSEVQQPVEFQDRPPTEEELTGLMIEPKDDVYAPVIMATQWQAGKTVNKTKKNQ